MKKTALILAALAIIATAISCQRSERKPGKYYLSFAPEVDTSDLNTDDVFRITARKNDTLILSYYY